ESAMFGKFHLAGPENNAAGINTPTQLGWDHFYGWVDGVPGSIDTTAGGLAPENTYACGFVPAATAGACHYADQSCQPMRQQNPLTDDTAGMQCVTSGGVFVPDQACGTPPPTLRFDQENAYYVSPLVIINDGVAEQIPLSDPRARGY